jgi:hypothetical protein
VKLVAVLRFNPFPAEEFQPHHTLPHGHVYRSPAR